ncbi:telomere stability and silencing-domain-containing protein [Phellopilus nigrolimitatus]|nr:telomere stability and silencing-domain-containing protein [Phellopilus nigrolimitatus]
MLTTLLISTFSPFPTLTLTLPAETSLSEVPSLLPDFLPSFEDGDFTLSLPSGTLTLDSTPLSALCSPTASLNGDEMNALSNKLVSLRLAPRLRGGKGGFGSQLRAAGGRMSSQKTSNNDSCRDLNGRRLSTIKEAKALASYLESEPERKKAQQEAQRVKLEKLERKLGIDGKGKEKADDVSVGVKRRFDDTEYLEQSRDIVENVKSAVLAGMLKKKKKAKTSPPPQEASGSSSKVGEGSSSGTDETIQTATVASDEGTTNAAEEVSHIRTVGVSERVLESPAAASAASTASITLASVGA